MFDSTAAAVEALAFLDGYPPYEQLASILISGSADGIVRLWNPHAGALLVEIDAIGMPLPAPVCAHRCAPMRTRARDARTGWRTGWRTAYGARHDARMHTRAHGALLPHLGLWRRAAWHALQGGGRA